MRRGCCRCFWYASAGWRSCICRNWFDAILVTPVGPAGLGISLSFSRNGVLVGGMLFVCIKESGRLSGLDILVRSGNI